MAGVKGKSGPAALNVNAMTNGVRISRLVLGELPATMRRQLQSVRKYRRYLEQLVVNVHDGVDDIAAHLIDEACAAETHATICRWLLRTRLEVMTVTDITKCSEQILKAKTVRNRAVERLKLDAQPQDPWVVAVTPNGNA